MKTKSLSPLGSLHPILFFAGLYAVALVLSIFICSSLFYTFNPRSSEVSELSIEAEKQAMQQAETTIALR